MRAGWCSTVNPFNGVETRVSLARDDVAGFVFWTRFATPMLPRLAELDTGGYPYCFHVTINGYGRDFEARNPAASRATDAFRALAGRISPSGVIWRYDPIIFSSTTDPDWHVRNFERLARSLAGHTRRCYFSFLDVYGKTKRNLVALEKRGGPALDAVDPIATRHSQLATRLRDIAETHGMRLYACCEDSVLAGGIHKGRCIDPELLGIEQRYPAKPTREQCGCVESVDIGAYDTCRFGCVDTATRPTATTRRSGRSTARIATRPRSARRKQNALRLFV